MKGIFSQLCWSKVCRRAEAETGATRSGLSLVAALAVGGFLFLPLDAFAARVTVTWDPSSNALGYTVFYGTGSGNYTEAVDVGNQTSLTLSGLTPNVTHYFVVRAYNAARDYSEFSAEVSGVPTATLFTDDPLISGVHSMRAVHLRELRASINKLRVKHQLPLAAWSETLPQGLRLIKAVHITELRAALKDVFAAMGRAAPEYTPIAGGLSIKAAHIAELRIAVNTLE